MKTQKQREKAEVLFSGLHTYCGVDLIRLDDGVCVCVDLGLVYE